LKTTAKKLGDQYIVGPQPKRWRDQSLPVPTVVAPMRIRSSGRPVSSMNEWGKLDVADWRSQVVGGRPWNLEIFAS